ncbi:hypothetical protein KY284_035803 [Solanum tuberosum]|nr:hypothetical protein KY284_035803 [Solanum tuberosum]
MDTYPHFRGNLVAKRGWIRIPALRKEKRGCIRIPTLRKAKRGRIRIPSLRKFEEMMIFRQYISPSTKLSHLVVEIEEAEDQTRFLTHTPLVGQYVSQWHSLKNSFHTVNWTSVHTHTSNNLLKLWSLEAPDHHLANIATLFQGIGSGPRIYLVGAKWYWAWPKFMMSFMHLYSLITVIQTFYKRSVKLGAQKPIHFLHLPDNYLFLYGIYILLEAYRFWVLSMKKYCLRPGNLLDLMKRGQNTFLGLVNIVAAFHHLRGANQEVSFSKWISFLCKKPQRYETVPPREEKKSAHPELTYNPSGGLT